MINEEMYQNYLKALLAGKRLECHDMVKDLVEADVAIRCLYIDLFQRSLYEVGELWANNVISVANEHLATAITESLMTIVYPKLFAAANIGKSVVIACTPNEQHQIGGKMVADIFESHGWAGHFLGANTPVESMIEYIDDTKPDMAGLSLSILSNIGKMKQGMEAIRSDFPGLDLLVGGQAFLWGGLESIPLSSGVEYCATLDDLEKIVNAA